MFIPKHFLFLCFQAIPSPSRGINTVKPSKVKTPMENMVELGLIQQPVFTVKVSNEAESSFYTFGQIDKVGQLQLLPPCLPSTYISG